MGCSSKRNRGLVNSGLPFDPVLFCRGRDDDGSSFAQREDVSVAQIGDMGISP